MEQEYLYNDPLSRRIFNLFDELDEETAPIADELKALRLENATLRQTIKLNDGLRQRFEELYDNATLGLLTISGADYILEANLTLSRLLKMQRNELIGQHVGSFIATPDHCIFIHHLNHVRESGITDACQLRMIDSNGNLFNARLESSPIPEEAGLPNAALRTSVNMIQQTSLDKPNTNEHEDTSDSMERRSAALTATNQQLIAEIQQHENAETELHHHQGQLEELVTKRTQQLETINRQLRREIIEREHAEEKTRQHQERLAHISRLNTVGEMASGLAHEINQPLTAISTYTQSCLHRLRAGDDPESIKTTLEQVVMQARRAANIVQHLRNFVVKGKPHREPSNLAKIVSFALKMVRSEIIKNEIKFDIKRHDSLPSIEADPIQVEQVVLNLLRNAIDAMKEVAPEKRHLTIEFRTIKNTHVCVAIHDTGPGFKHKDIDKISTPFFSTKESGMGLGLAISRTIIEDHGGRLSYKINDKGGATFLFTLAINGQPKPS